MCVRDVGLSQRSLHNAPIFRLLLKVAVKGTHQCDSYQFLRGILPNATIEEHATSCRSTRQLHHKTYTLSPAPLPPVPASCPLHPSHPPTAHPSLRGWAGGREAGWDGGRGRQGGWDGWRGVGGGAIHMRQKPLSAKQFHLALKNLK